MRIKHWVFFSSHRRSLQTAAQVYDAINEDSKLPNIEYPDTDASNAIIEFHACKYQSYVEKSFVQIIDQTNWKGQLSSLLPPTGQ